MSGFTNLIQNIGDENIEYQNINNCVIESKKTRHNDYEITFPSKHMSPGDVLNNTGKIGLVVWVDRDVLKSAYDKVKD